MVVERCIADYADTKAALIGYSKGVARDLGRRGITVNVVQAGMMATDIAAASADKLPPGIMDLLALGRIARVEEVAAGIVFLASPAASYITGAVLDVNGGYLVSVDADKGHRRQRLEAATPNG